MHDHQGFENFRRERNKRRMEGGPLRPMGQNAAILRELEAAEQREVRNQQLTREVHEFFADATRTAATIVSQVAENAEEQLQESVSREMSEFLAETMRRVQQFVQLVHVSAPGGVAQKDMQANIQNIVGATLDEFRFAGDAATAEAHVGQDPFDTEVDVPAASQGVRRPASEEQEGGMAPRLSLDEHLQPADAPPPADEHQEWQAEPSPAGEHQEFQDAPPPPVDEHQEWQDEPSPVDEQPKWRDEPSPIEEHLAAQIQQDEEGLFEDLPDPADPFAEWFQQLREDDEATRNVLRLLVRANFMTKDEARVIYRAR